MMNDVDNIRSKVRKLLALAALNSGGTEDERMTAMKMAMALMLKHGIEQDALGADEAAIKAKYGNVNRQKLRDYQVSLASAAAALYGCKAMFYRSGKAGFVFVGREDNIDAAEQTLFWLMAQVEQLYKKAMPKGMSGRDAPRNERGVYLAVEFRRNFKRTCAYRVWQRAEELVSNPALMARDAGSTALVVSGYFEKLREENDAVTGKIKPMRGGRVRLGFFGRDEGRAAGDQVKLRKEVEA